MGNNEIKIFSSDVFGKVRTVGDAENPQFCLADVCRVCGLQANQVARRLSDDVFSKHTVSDSIGRQQVVNFINEDGLYDIFMGSRKPEAKAFRKWITSEVIPSIRKTGGYMAVREDDTPEDIMARALLIAKSRIDDLQTQNNTLETEKEQLETKLEIAQPKAEYCDKVLSSESSISTVCIAKGIGMSAQALNAKLKECGVQFRQSGQWLLCAKYQNMGLAKNEVFAYTSHDRNCTHTYLKWTEKGRMFINYLQQNGWNVKVALKEIEIA